MRRAWLKSLLPQSWTGGTSVGDASHLERVAVEGLRRSFVYGGRLHGCVSGSSPSSCVPLDKWPPRSGLDFLISQMGIIVVSTAQAVQKDE